MIERDHAAASEDSGRNGLSGPLSFRFRPGYGIEMASDGSRIGLCIHLSSQWFLLPMIMVFFRIGSRDWTGDSPSLGLIPVGGDRKGEIPLSAPSLWVP